LKSGTGILKSEVINGFEIRIESIFDVELSFEELNRILKK